MGCEKCNPYTPPIVRNRAGFPAYGQLSPKKTPLRMYESPKSRIKSGYKVSHPPQPNQEHRSERITIT